jgi:dTDP-4-amino-4,6-dideoxygalactose transaminase
MEFLNDEYIRSSRPYFFKSDIELIFRDLELVLESGKFRNGQNLRRFEENMAAYLGIGNCVALDSDLSALETALQYFNVENREVIVCTNSFISVPNSVLYAGGRVVFADIKKETLSMDPASVKKSVSPRTSGVIVTHIAGFPNPDLQEIAQICDENKLFLIEDATHALGAMIGNRKVGCFGDAAIFAFTPTKVITAGEGGMLATGDDGLAGFARLNRYYGSGAGKTNFERLGRHMMLPEVSAVLGIYQLRRVEEFVARRNQIAQVYNEAFSRLEGVSIVACPHGNRCSYYKYPITLNSKVDKEKLVKTLTNLGIETGTVFYPPCHMQPVYKRQNLDGSYLPVAKEVLSRTVTLPMHYALNDLEVLDVVMNVRLAVESCF